MTIWANIIKRFRAPALPLPTRTYDPQYFDKLLSVLRIYFNQLDNILERIVDGSATTVPVSIGGTNVDAFGRLRVSQPYTLFDSQTVDLAIHGNPLFLTIGDNDDISK